MEKLLKLSNFFFFHNDFYVTIAISLKFYYSFSLSSANSFNFEWSKFVIWYKGLTVLIVKPITKQIRILQVVADDYIGIIVGKEELISLFHTIYKYLWFCHGLIVICNFFQIGKVQMLPFGKGLIYLCKRVRI